MMFRHRLQLRRWAARMVVLWLFGVGVGIANACLVPHVVGLPGDTVRAFAAADASNGGAGTDRDARQHGAHHAHDDQGADHADHGGSAAASNCHDFCDKVAFSILPLKSTLDHMHGHALPPSAASTAAPLAPMPWVQTWMPRRDGAWAPPIPISFLRLAL